MSHHEEAPMSTERPWMKPLKFLQPKWATSDLRDVQSYNCRTCWCVVLEKFRDQHEAWHEHTAENEEPLTVTAIYRQEPSESVRGCVVLEVLGGPKAYLRIWDGGERDWGWRAHVSAQQVWPPL